jgi:hypothetical protein
MSCWRRCPIHKERGRSRLRVGRQWSISVVLCCVLWVVGLQAEYCNVRSTSMKWQIQKSCQMWCTPMWAKALNLLPYYEFS